MGLPCDVATADKAGEEHEYCPKGDNPPKRLAPELSHLSRAMHQDNRCAEKATDPARGSDKREVGGRIKDQEGERADDAAGKEEDGCGARAEETLEIHAQCGAHHKVKEQMHG